MTLPLLPPSSLGAALAALRADLIHPGGPQLSTMRNYRFALLQYDPSAEFELRREVSELTSELRREGWFVLPLSLQSLFLERVRAQGPEWVERVLEMERRMTGIDQARGLGYVQSKIMPLIEGAQGLASDCARVINEHIDAHPDQVDRTLAIIGRAGAVYPFFRSSALLRHLDGRTRNVPVVLLYPGQRRGATSLSFMGVLDPESDYRPRIYS
jgi:Domain of unknown function (DUF1788)